MDIEEEQQEASNQYDLTVHDQANYSVKGEYIFDIKQPKGIHSVKFNHNDQYLAAGYRDGYVRIFNVMTKNLTCELDCNTGNDNEICAVQAMKWRPKIEGRTNNILLTACRDTIMEWHTPSRKIVHKKTFPDNTIFSVEYSNDGMHYALGLKDLSIRVFDGVTKKEEIKLGGFDNHKVIGHMNKILALKYHKDNPKILIAGGWDGIFFIWDLNTGTPVRIVNGPLIFGEGLDTNCFNEILTASWRKDDALQIWDYETGELKTNIDWNFKEKEENIKASTQLYCCKYSNDFGKLIFAGGSQVNAVKIFDYNGKGIATIDKLSHACMALDSSNDVTKGSQLLAIGGGEGSVRLFRISPNSNTI